MEYLPSIRFIGGKPAGFSQSEPTSEQSIAYFEKAYSLDPTLPYIAANYLFHQGAVLFGGNKYNPKTADQEQKRRFQAYLSTLHALMRAHSMEIWPTHHQLYALWLLKSSDPNDRVRVGPLLEELFRAEPKFKTREKLLASAL